MRGGRIERGFDRGLVAHVDHERQRLAAGLLDLGGGGVDGAFELGMRLDRLGGDGDIGAVARRLERDGEADAARGAGDEKRFSFERHRFPRPALCACDLARLRFAPARQGNAPPPLFFGGPG